MDIIGKEVIHNTFRHGVVKAMKNDVITVAFKMGEKIFLYPSIFEKMMVAVDEDVNDYIKQDVAAFQAVRQEKDRLALAKRQEANELELQNSMLKKKVSTRASSRQAAPKKVVRDPDKRSVFFVFQEKKFDREHAGEYIWAPDSSGSVRNVGSNPIIDVRKGDVIFHGHDAKIWALSKARSSAYPALHPDDLFPEEKQDAEGHKVDCEYFLIQNPVKTEEFREEIISYSNEIYAPFDKNGDGNTAYFYSLNRNLALIFLQGLMKKNSDLEKLDYVRDLLTEL